METRISKWLYKLTHAGTLSARAGDPARLSRESRTSCVSRVAP